MDYQKDSLHSSHSLWGWSESILFLRSDYNLRASFSVYMVAFPVYRPGHYSWRLVSTHALQCSVGQWILKITQSKMHFHIIFICGLALSLTRTFLLVFFSFCPALTVISKTLHLSHNIAVSFDSKLQKKCLQISIYGCQI